MSDVLSISLGTICDRDDPVVSVLVVTIEYNYRIWELFYTTFTVK